MSSRHQMDMCHGPLLKQVFTFAVPLVFSNILQLLFNAADLIVLGRFAPYEEMAAVGATGSLSALLVTIFMGISMGANVLAARYFGAKDKVRTRLSVETAIATALYVGIALIFVGLALARPMLKVMGTPENILDHAALYMWITFLGMPMMLIYNYGCSLLRAFGDTLRPFYYLAIAGVINVALNILLVTAFGMGIAGVAIATVISQTLSAALILRALTTNRGCHLNWRRLKINWTILKEMLGIGIPSGLQGACFSISNVVIQSSINSLGSYAVAGSAASGSAEGLVWIISFSFLQASVSFTAQNLGGKQYVRIVKSMRYCALFGIAGTLILGTLGNIFSTELIGIFNTDPQVIDWGSRRLSIIVQTYFICAVMETLSGGLRGLGYSGTAAVSSLAGACLFRLLWVWLVFPRFHTIEGLCLSYPISWFLTALFNYIVVRWVCVRMFRKNGLKPMYW